MDKEVVTRYAPVVLIVFMMFFQYNLFVTPVTLEETHREILREVQDHYVSKEQYNDLKKTIDNMQVKIDKIYDVIMRGKK